MTASTDGGTASRALVYASVAAAVAAFALLLWHALPYLLLIFFGVLLALLLRAPANWLAKRTALGPGAALALVAFAILAVPGIGAYFLGQAVAMQSLELGERLPQIVDTILERIRGQTWGQRLIDFFTAGEEISAPPLALIVGLLNFIPYVGPIVSAIPAVLVGFSESTQMALYIVLLFIALQSLEGYILEPIIQNKAVFLPPALILFAQIIAGLLAGPIGLAVATPLAAALMVAVKMLYIEDVLNDTTALHETP